MGIPAWSFWSSIAFAYLAYGTAIAATDADFARCRAIDDLAARLRCYQSFLDQTQQSPQPGASIPTESQMIGQWRLIRTPDPKGGGDAISITRPGELAGSDPNFVGMMIRCVGRDIEVLVVLLQPLSPRARPVVVVNGTEFDGKIVPPGSIRLPPDLSVAARDLWPRLSSLSLRIDHGGSSTKGLVLLDGLKSALDALAAACPAR